MGPRQAGKTTIVKHLQQKLKQQKKQTVFLNLDIERDFSLFESQERLLQSLRSMVGMEPAYIFLDEFQRKEDGGRFLKGLYDMDLPYKFVVTGSGSIELKEKVHESLSGRKRLFEVLPLSFVEYFNFRTDYQYQGWERLADFALLDPQRYNTVFQEYLAYGGYPRLALEKRSQEKQKLIQEIYDSYLIKDVAALLNVERTGAFRRLIKLLAALNGKLVNVSSANG